MAISERLPRRVFVGVTGASGAVYAERLIELLLKNNCERIYVSFSNSGKQVVEHELKRKPDGFSLLDLVKGQISPEYRDQIRVFDDQDFFSPVASGTSVPTDMVILPCSMGTLARVATGMSLNLIERVADVVLKQKKRLVLCPRETPLNSIHLRNMLTLSNIGAFIVPPMPAFYNKPDSMDDLINFSVGRVLEVIDVEHSLYKPWNARMV